MKEKTTKKDVMKKVAITASIVGVGVLAYIVVRDEMELRMLSDEIDRAYNNIMDRAYGE